MILSKKDAINSLIELLGPSDPQLARQEKTQKRKKKKKIKDSSKIKY